MRSSAKTAPTSPIAPTRRSAATAISWPIWCGDCWRTAPTRPLSRSPPTRRCRCRNCCGVRPTSSAAPKMPRIRTSRCRAISTGRNGKTPAASNSANARRWSNSSRPSPPNRLPAAGSIADATPRARPMRRSSAARDGFKHWSQNAGRDARGGAGEGRRSAGTARGAFHRAAATRGRQDTGRCGFGSPRGRGFLPLLCRAGPRTVRRRQGDAGTDRREQRALPARPWRLRRDLAVEFSAGDLSGPGHGGA